MLNKKSGADCVCAYMWIKEKASGKSRQGGQQVKETVQEYIGGADTITEDPASRDYVVTRSRLMAAKCVIQLSFLPFDEFGLSLVSVLLEIFKIFLSSLASL